MSDWIDFRQSRQIRELEDELSYMSASLSSARASTRRLKAEMSRLTGSLETRLSRLSAAFDAFVEISDLRITLALFDEHARIRYRAQQLFGGSPVPGELSDVDDYWLAPALAAVHAIVDGKPAAEALELARARDPRRAAPFHVLATAYLGRADAVRPGDVAEALPALEPSVPRYQRAVWTVAADGHLGAAGRDLVLARGVAALATLSDSDRENAVAAWQRAVKPERNVALPKELGPATDLIAALDAAERLAVLRHWVGTALAAGDAAPGEPDPIVGRTLELLVAEGSPLELPLLARERELRQVIENGGSGGGEPDSWESPVGSIVELLQADAVDEDHPARRAVAVRICAAHVLEAADRFAERARRPLGDRTRVRTQHGELVITPAGPEPGSLEQAQSRATVNYVVGGRRRTTGYAAAAVGLLLAVLAVVAGWGWLVPAVVAGALAGWQLVRDRAERVAAREHVARIREELRAAADRCVEHLDAARTELKQRRSRIDDDLAALRAALT